MFIHLNPTKLQAFYKGYELRKRLKDEEMWLWWGSYGLSAFETVMAHFSAGLAGKSSKAKYIEKPILSNYKGDNSQNPESNEEIAVFEMKQRTRQLEKLGLRQSPE